jgi:hypothetical protein
MRKMVVLIICLILILGYGCSSPLSPDKSPDVVYVDINNKSGKEDGSFSYPFTSIAKGVQNAKEGATIVVRPGTYREMEIVMKKGQKLQGSGAENTIIERAGYGLIVLNSGCEVSGFYIKSQWSGTILDPAIKGENCENIKIFNNKIYYPDSVPIALERASGNIFNNELRTGIAADYCKDLVIENNKIEGIPVGWRTGVSYGTGISIVGSSPIIRNNHIFNCGDGINISMAVGDVVSSPLIENNIIENNKVYGIRIAPFPCEADFGGGKRGSTGGNIIRNNGKCDFLNESPSEIYAQYNTWTHSTEEEIDRYDIWDDDEGKGGKVIFVPFKGGGSIKKK